MRRAIFAALLAAALVSCDSKLRVEQLYYIETSGPECPTAQLRQVFFVYPHYLGSDVMGLCYFEGDGLVLRFLREPGDPPRWYLDRVFEVREP